MVRRLVTGTFGFFSTFLCTLFYTSYVHASDFVVLPNVFSGVSYLDYEQKAGFFPSSGLTFSDYKVAGFAPLVGAGLTLKYGPFYLTVEGQHTFEANDSDNLTIAGPTFAQKLDLDSDFKRFEVNVTGAYNVTDEFSVFAGYKYADADISNDITGENNVSGFLPLGFPVTGDLDIDFTYQGPFAGISYDLSLKESLGGVLSFSSAFSYYFADITQKFRPSGGVPLPSSKDSANAESLGYNFQIGWRGAITSDWYYRLNLATSMSDFDTHGDASDFKETEYRFRVGLEYAIDAGPVFGRGSS